MAPIYFTLYKVGAWVLQVPVSDQAFTMSWEWFGTEFLGIWQPLILGCLLCGLVAAFLGIVLVRIIWRLMVIRNWIRRKQKNIDNC